jgi:hypothetical protein
VARTYSFPDITLSLYIPKVGDIYLGAGTGHTEGGLTIAMTEDKNTMTVGADGQVMHSLHAGVSGMVTIRLLKTATANGTISDAYHKTTVDGASHGQAKISMWDVSRADGDFIDCTQVAFAKYADLTYGKEGGEMVWTFHCGQIKQRLGPKPVYTNGAVTYTGEA